MKNMTRSSYWARQCTWLANRNIFNVEVDEWHHGQVSYTFRDDKFVYHIILKHMLVCGLINFHF